MSTFDIYSAPPADALYSTSYFKKLDFDAAVTMDFPRIAPPGSLHSILFDTLVPTKEASTLVASTEEIPCLSDMRPVIEQLPHAWDAGSRSVVAQFKVNGHQKAVVFHFSKIRLIINVNNNRDAVRSSKALVEHFKITKLIGDTWLTALGRSLIHEPVSGFITSSHPLWKWGYLLGENWLEEDLVNTILEFLYFRNLSENPDANILILPTLAFNEATYLFDSQRASDEPQLVYSPNLVSIRERIQATSPTAIYLVLCRENHYSQVKYDTASGSLEYRDSLGHSPDPSIYLFFRSLLYGLDIPHPHPHPVRSVPVPMQLQAHGSCGVAAVNAVEHALSPTLRALWNDPTSTYHRDRYLRSLVIYSLIAAQHPGNPALWTLPEDRGNVPPHETITTVTTGPLGYEDFNLFRDSDTHPIHILDEVMMKEMWQEVIYSPHAAAGHLPSVSTGRTALIQKQPAIDGASEEPPSESTMVAGCAELVNLLKPNVKREALSPLLVTPSFAALPIKIASPLIKTEPGVSGPIATIKPEPDSPSIPPSQFLDLSYLSTSSSSGSKREKARRKRKAQKVNRKRRQQNSKDGVPQVSAPSDVIDLSSPSPKLEPSDNSELPCRFPSVIDLCTASPSPPPPSSRPLSSHPSSDYIVITSSSESDSDSDSDRRPHPASKLAVKSSPKSDPLTTLPQVQLGTVFSSIADAKLAVYGFQEAQGYSWRVAQSKVNKDNVKKKVTLRCRCYYRSPETHDPTLDPSEHRKSKSVRTGCQARANINRIAGTDLWNVTLVDFTHNHSRELAEGGRMRPRPTEEQKNLISTLTKAPTTSFNRSQIAAALHATLPNATPLELRQVSNIINTARREGDAEVKALGGDVMAVLASLQKLKDLDPNWVFYILLDDQQRLVSLWWQSPAQAELTRRYPDILLNDNTYNRNKYGFPLNIGIVIDNFGHSRNAWYCLQELEDADTHAWVFRNHLRSAGRRAPETLVSDRSQALLSAAAITMPTTFHALCLYHLDGNITTNLRPLLGSSWDDFRRRFWAMYRSASPAEFEGRWQHLILAYPQVEGYLGDLITCKEQWAWVWVMTRFTGGIRTNGRVEGENRVSKMLGGPKKTFLEVFNALNERTSQQSVQEGIEFRQGARRQHPGQIEGVFASILGIIREYAGPFAVQTAFRQMENSMYYSSEVVQLPHGMKDWNARATPLLLYREREFEWANGEEMSMFNRFENDSAHISPVWLVQRAVDRGLRVTHLLKITHLSSRVPHFLLVLEKDQYMCDCAMGLNLGVPCRHFFHAWTTFGGLRFQIGLIRRRWYKNPNLDTTEIPAVAFNPVAPITQPSNSALPSVLLANPLHTTSTPGFTPPATQTVGAREVNHEAHAVLRPILESVRTAGDLEDVLEDLRALKRARTDAESEGHVRDPIAPNPTGRPRSARITSRLEGRPRGGGPTRSLTLQSQSQVHSGPHPVVPAPTAGQSEQRRCGRCRQIGHNRTRCPLGP